YPARSPLIKYLQPSLVSLVLVVRPTQLRDDCMPGNDRLGCGHNRQPQLVKCLNGQAGDVVRPSPVLLNRSQDVGGACNEHLPEDRQAVVVVLVRAEGRRLDRDFLKSAEEGLGDTTEDKLSPLNRLQFVVHSREPGSAQGLASRPVEG